MLGFGEAHMDGSLTLKKGTIYDCLTLYVMNDGEARPRRRVEAAPAPSRARNATKAAAGK